MENNKRLIVTAVIILFGLIALFSTCGYERIDSGHAGIQVELFGSEKGVQGVALVNGGQFYNKWTQEIYEFATYIQHVVWDLEAGEPNEELAVTTSDGMTLRFDVGFDYQVIPERVPAIFQKYRKDLPSITNEFLRTAVRNSYNDVAGRFISDTLLFKRNTYEKEVKKDLTLKLKEDFIVAQLAIIGEIRVSSEMRTAINAKITANQNAQTAQNLVNLKEAEANQKIEVARGDSAELVIKTSSEAFSTKMKADADAYYNQKVNQSLTSTLLEWQKIQSWDGKLPTYQGGLSPIMQMPK